MCGRWVNTAWPRSGRCVGPEFFSSLYPDIELLTFNPAVFAQIDWERDLWNGRPG